MINVGIIGMGGVSRTHIETYRKFDERCEIVALSDTFRDKAEIKKEEFGLTAPLYEDYRDLLDQPNVDLVSICTPPYTHAQITIDALQAGKHVICEKPMASSLEECDQMNVAREKSGKKLAIVAQNRFRDPVRKLKAVIDSGVAGKILHAQVDSYWWRGHCYYDLWWRGTWEKEGGGCTLNHAVHHIDMFLWMMGMPSEVRAVLSNTAHNNAEVEDISIGILKYDTGSLAQITSSVVHHGEQQSIIFQTEKARLAFPWNVYASTSRSNGFPDQNPELERELTAIYDKHPKLKYELYEGEFDNVFTAIETDADVLVDGHEGRKTLELIMAMYQSHFTGSLAKIPVERHGPFYSRESIKEHVVKFHEKGESIDNFDDDTIIIGSSTDQK